MTVRGLSVSTRQAYLHAVASLAKFHDRRPDDLTNREFQRFLVHLIEDRGLSWGTCNSYVHGLRLFYRVALGRGDTDFSMPRAKEPIPIAEQSKLFERFFRASMSTGIAGSGIGLLLASHLVELHGGSIDFESSEDEGTTFFVRLPVDGPSLSIDAAAWTTAHEHRRRSSKSSSRDRLAIGQ